MNSLSWLIYAADVSQSLDLVTLLGSSAATMFVGASLYTDTSERRAWDHQLNENKRYPSLYAKPEGLRPGPTQPLIGFRRSALIVIAAMVSINVVFPSAPTLYAIAASEMGEEVIKPPTATKAVKALDAWLDQQIAKNGAGK